MSHAQHPHPAHLTPCIFAPCSQVMLRRGLVAALPRTAGTRNVKRLLSALDLVYSFTMQLVEDARREGMPVCVCVCVCVRAIVCICV